MELLLDPRTVNSRKVLAGFKLIGADYSINKFDYFEAEQKSPDFVAINPNAAFPVLKDGDFILWESNAIEVIYVDYTPPDLQKGNIQRSYQNNEQ